MKAAYSGAASEELALQLQKDGKKYGISVGRRQPVHAGHVFCILDIVNAGLIPVIFIGSANDKDNKNYDPLKNPLTAAQQVEQIKLVMKNNGIDEFHIIPIADVGDREKWTTKVIESLNNQLGENAHTQAIFHFIGKASDDIASKKDIQSLSAYVESFHGKGVASWQSVNTNKELDRLNATSYRNMDLSSAEFLALPAGIYIAGLAIEARKKHGFAKTLGKLEAPVTMRDITLLHLKLEHGIKPENLSSDKGGFASLSQLDAAIALKIEDIKNKKLHSHS